MSPRPHAEAQVARILAIIPYLVDHPGALVAEVAERFGIGAEQLRRDLDLVLMVGVPPYSPGDYVDVEVTDDDRITLRMADAFRRPLRLTADEALALVSAGRTLMAVPGNDADGTLAGALTKLERRLDLPSLDIDVESPRWLDEVRDALEHRRQIEIDYWAAGRDAETTRRVDPGAVFFALGAWYLGAWCHKANAERLFRIDRIRALRPTDQAATVRHSFEFAPDAAAPVFQPRSDDPRVTLHLAPAAEWVADSYPTERVTPLDDGRLEVELAVSESAWLERLLLRLGTDAVVVAPEDFTTMAATTAARVLNRYEATT